MRRRLRLLLAYLVRLAKQERREPVTVIRAPEPRERTPRAFLPPIPMEEAWTGFYLHKLLRAQRTDVRERGSR